MDTHVIKVWTQIITQKKFQTFKTIDQKKYFPVDEPWQAVGALQNNPIIIN